MPGLPTDGDSLFVLVIEFLDLDGISLIACPWGIIRDSSHKAKE